MTDNTHKAVALSTAMAVGMFALVASVSAGELVNKRDVMQRVGAGQDSNHTISFDLSAGTDWDAGDTLTISFPAGFNLNGVAVEDFDIVTGGAAEETLVAVCGGGDEIELTSVAGQVVTFTACAGYTPPGAGSSIEIEIGDNADGGDTQITNPGAGNDLKMDIAGTIGDVGSLALSILADDQIVVTATVDPTLSFTLDSNACALGTLGAGQVSKCAYTTTVSTNGTNGYNSTVYALSDGTNINLNRDDDATEFIDDVADGSVDAGSEEYGINTSQAGNPGILSDGDANCVTGGGSENASALTAAPQVYATANAPVAADATTLCHSASITALTEAGNYTQTVVVATTGNF